MTAIDRFRRLHPLWGLALAAIALRLLLFLGRGDYVAFDEGWYLVLGRNLMAGDGYTLAGLRHVALSPLFPILAGALGWVIRDPVWAGRIVAAITAGLLVVPCWYLFRRVGGQRTALLGCALITVMPSLAPFVAAFWIGWDLWVGAEPVLHLFLYSGLALCLYALDRRGALRWAAAGVAFGLAFVARQEALLVFALVTIGLLAVVVARRRPRQLAGVLLLGLASAATVAPYSLYLHDVLGRWTISGRFVTTPPPSLSMPAMRRADTASARPRAPRPIDDMLWRDDRAYVRGLYSLDPSGTRLLDSYWGLPRKDARDTHVSPTGGDAQADGADAPLPRDPTTGAQPPAVTPPAPTARPQPAPEPIRARGSSRIVLYVAALRRIIPVYVVPLILVGLLLPRRRWSWREPLIVLPLLAASGLIAALIAVDPRTQLLIVPIAAYYAARGIRAIGLYIDARVRGHDLRRGFATRVLGGITILVLLGTNARLLYLSTTIGSPHHIVGAQNRLVGTELRQTLPPDATVMSWHPALALFAHRDWRVLPHAPFRDIVRYANAIGTEHLVLSAYYPGPVAPEELPREYVLVRVRPGSAAAPAWTLQIEDTVGPLLRTRLEPLAAPPAASDSVPRAPPHD